MKKLIYMIDCYTHVYNEQTEEAELIPSLSEVTVWNPTDADIKRAKETAHNGEYTIVDDGESNYPIASHNIFKGEYVTIDGVLYKATENIPNGEPVIVGQNAIKTTVEEQLYELKGE